MSRMLDTLSDRTLELGPVRDAAPEGNWRVGKDGAGTLWLVLDRPGRSVNTIDRSVLEELNGHLARAEAERPARLVIRSAKAAGFAAGADIKQFVGASSAEIAAMLAEGHRVLDRLEALPVPTLAVIHGHCLGAGLELALACDRRIATPDASLGFPEVMLGLHPGLGGTFRAPAVADPVEAMTMMLTGKSAHARKAKAIGLVDEIVEERHVAAAVAASGAAERSGGLKARAFSLKPARGLVARQMRKSAEEKAPSRHYPAPYRLIDNWEAHGADPKAMRAAEARSFAELIETPASRNLVRVFFLREAMRGLRQGKSGIGHVHVIGAGAMGGDIAAWAAREGFRVTLGDIEPRSIGGAMKRATKMLEATLREPGKVRDALDRLIPDLDGAGAQHADLVIEAAPETLDLKRRIYADIEPKLKDGALLSTNTSALPLEALAEGLADPSRFFGLHFFNPVSRMQLVEIVRHAGAGEEALRRATAFAVEISRLPAPVTSAPGFLVNRALTPYMAEALILVDEGVPKERIDRIAEDFGMPMGPIELTDQVGLDIALAVSASLRERLETAFPETPAWLTKMVEEGRLGRKSGRGLYEYEDGKPKKAGGDNTGEADGAEDAELLDRMILPMLNAVVACLREGVVADERIADGAMIFGTGFAPFRGGPMHYARERGIEDVVARLDALATRHGPRFRPDAGWDALAAEPQVSDRRKRQLTIGRSHRRRKDVAMYKAPVEEISFSLRKIAGLDAAMESGLFDELSPDLVDAILDEAGKFASEEIAPLGASGEREGARFEDGTVTMPKGWRDLYARWADAGWNALTGPQSHGGQGLPTALSAAVAEMWNGASMAFAIGPTLTIGAVDALEIHGTEHLKSTYLDRLVSGTWMGTMNLTEPQAGSDLSALRTRAERREDGTYRLFGQKIYITYGEHDLTENIVHLVLARLPDAPAGVKGISLFLVPKFVPEADGTLGSRNDVKCHSIEHKMGIHGSPTCTMIYGDGGEGAIGWLVGEENKGLACMFTMMNSARLYVGIQGLGVAEAATQKALAYAKERRQGRSTLLAKNPEPSNVMSPIVEHPDVARMLLTMKALTGSARAIAYACGHAIDMSRTGEADERKRWAERASLLTPLAKAFPTDVGVEVASLGLQVHGGMGYIEETGAARLLRDARIAPIYEGTNGIQSIDLVVRKLPLSDGAAVAAYIDELAAIAEEVRASNRDGFGRTAEALADALNDLRATTDFLLGCLRDKRTDEALAGATAYLRLFSLTAGASYLAKGAMMDEADKRRTALARFAAENLLVEVAALRRQVTEGAASLEAARAVLA